MTKWKDIPIKKKILFILGSFLSLVLLLDYLFFYKIFYKFPNELEWDTSPWYNFRHEVINMKPFSYFEDGILIAGSSVALYSALPNEIETKLNENRNSERVYKIRFFSHVAMSPTDFYYYLDDLIEKKPKLVVYLLNPGDFQFDYFLLDPNGSFLGYSEKQRLEHYATRFPVKHIYPGKFVWDNFQSLNKDQVFQLLTKQILNVNRNRLFFFDPIHAYIERHHRKGKSYHNFTGKIPSEGIYLKGWTKQSFTIQCETKKDELDDFIYNEIQDNELLATYKETSYTFPLKKGWNRINLKLSNEDTSKIIQFHSKGTISSKVIDPKSYAKEKYYGIRLSQNFCKEEIEQNIAYKRVKSLEDEDLFNMTIEEFNDDYYNRLYRDANQRNELIRQNHSHKVKRALAEKLKFQPWSEWNSLKEIKTKLTKKGIPFIIINNPEISLERNIYTQSEWYKGYLDELKSYEDEVNTFFYDFNNVLEDDRLFLDSHHLTYYGANLMTPIYSTILRRHVSNQ
jgi:hypothetical protein